MRGNAEFSLVMIKNRAIQRAITAIPDTAWTPVRYPGAVRDPDTGAWISDAEVAEVPYTAFAATQDGEPPRFRIPDPIRSGPGTEDDLCENGVESSRLSSKTRP